MSVPEPSEDEVAAWAVVWSERPRWPVREALTWCATRDIEVTARVVLTSPWNSCDEFDLVGSVQAEIDIRGQSKWRRFVDERPAAALLRALQAANCRACGLFEGTGEVRIIGQVQWDNLQFGVPPKPQRTSSDAYKSAAMVLDQIPGIPWRNYWVGIGIEREGLMAHFKPLDRARTDDSEAAVRATIRCLSMQNGRPIARNKGAKKVASLHPGWAVSAVRALIKEEYPHVALGRPRRVPKSAD